MGDGESRMIKDIKGRIETNSPEYFLKMFRPDLSEVLPDGHYPSKSDQIKPALRLGGGGHGR